MSGMTICLTSLQRNITLPGASPLYPDAHCTKTGEVCRLTTGGGEINAASSITALIYSNLLNLTSTYFLVTGIVGINSHVTTTGSVTLPRYAVQFDLQYEFDSKLVPTNDSPGYILQNSFFPDETARIDYPGPGGIYGTEAFGLNDNLKERFVYLASIPKLNDTEAAQAYRPTYGYASANTPPSVVECATGTGNVDFSGSVLGNAFSVYTKLLTRLWHVI
jgi:purine nucleoside permease